MSVAQFEQVRDLLGFSNLELGVHLGYRRVNNQCRQIDNILNGKTPIKRQLVLALEALARRKNLYTQFRVIMGDGYPPKVDI